MITTSRRQVSAHTPQELQAVASRWPYAALCAALDYLAEIDSAEEVYFFRCRGHWSAAESLPGDPLAMHVSAAVSVLTRLLKRRAA